MTPPFSPDAARELAERLRQEHRLFRLTTGSKPETWPSMYSEAAASLLAAAERVERMERLVEVQKEDKARLVFLASRLNNGDEHFDHSPRGWSWLCFKCVKERAEKAEAEVARLQTENQQLREQGEEREKARVRAALKLIALEVAASEALDYLEGVEIPYRDRHRPLLALAKLLPVAASSEPEGEPA